MAFFICTAINKKIIDDYATSVRQSMTERGDVLPSGDETTAACWK
jgi:hypothetical protein